MEFTIKGFIAKDVTDFAKSKQWTEKVEVDGEEIDNPVSAGKHCKNYLRMMFKNDIKAERLSQAKAEVEETSEPDITVI